MEQEGKDVKWRLGGRQTFQKKSAHPARASSGVLLHRSLLVTSALEAKSS